MGLAIFSEHFITLSKGVTNGHRHNPSYHSYLGVGRRVANVGAQPELGIWTQRNHRADCCRSDSPAPTWEALNLATKPRNTSRGQRADRYGGRARRPAKGRHAPQ